MRTIFRSNFSCQGSWSIFHFIVQESFGTQKSLLDIINYNVIILQKSLITFFKQNFSLNWFWWIFTISLSELFCDDVTTSASATVFVNLYHVNLIWHFWGGTITAPSSTKRKWSVGSGVPANFAMIILNEFASCFRKFYDFQDFMYFGFCKQSYVSIETFHYLYKSPSCCHIELCGIYYHGYFCMLCDESLISCGYIWMNKKSTSIKGRSFVNNALI